MFPSLSSRNTQRRRRVFLEDKDGNIMFADLKNEFRSRSLSQISNPSAHQRELSILQLRKVKGEGNLALKPRLHSMAIRRSYINWVGTGQRSHVKIRNLAEGLLLLQSVASDV